MIQDEAKTKWCPAARVNAAANVDGFDYVSNRPQHDPHNCIGSACMAWRWLEAKRAEAFHEAVRAHMRQQAKPNAATATQEVYAKRGGEFERTEGFCGLAGTPQ